jgi:hypothetical protein
MGRDDAVRAGHFQQRVARARRLIGEHVHPCPGDAFLAQCMHQCNFVHDPTAREVKQDGARLHPAQFRLADQVARLWRERAMQRDGIGLFQHFIERHAARADGRCILVLRHQHPHAEGLGDARHRLADMTVAEDAQRAAMQILQWMVQQREMRGALPFTGEDVRVVAVHLPPQRQQQGEGVLRDRIGGIAADVAHRDAVLAAVIQIDIVGAGGRHGDEP